MKVESNKTEADALDGVGNPARDGDAGAGMTASRRNTVASDYKTRILECAKTNNYLRHVLKAFTAHDGVVDWEKAFPAVAVTMSEDSHALREMVREIEKNENAVFEQVKKLFKAKSAVEAILVIDKSGDRKDVTAAVSELIRQNSALAGGVADLKANPEIARIVESHTAGGRVDYAAALLEVVRILDRQNDALARQIDDVAAAEADLAAVWMCGAERGRDVVVAIRARLEALAEHYEARSLAYDAQAAVARPDETMPTKKAWRWQADLAFEVAEAISMVVGSPRNGHQAAGNGPCVDFTGAGGIKTRVSEKSQPAADLGHFTRCAENGQAAVAVGDGPVAAVGAAGGVQDV